MIHTWAKALAILALLGAVFVAGSKYGGSSARAKLEQERTAWATSQANALAAEMQRNIETVDQLRANHDKAIERAAQAESAASAASAAADAARTAGRRLRDASATDLLAARVSIEAAGATEQCAPAIEAAAVREVMLGRIDSIADEIGSAALGIARHADEAFNAATECAAAYKTVTR
jgi:hypothetical protein